MKSDAIYNDLRRLIKEGILVIGSKCPSETRLATDHGVSRTVVRVALQKLQREGYLDATQGSHRRIKKPKRLLLEKMRLERERTSVSFGEYLDSEKMDPRDVVVHDPIVTTVYGLSGVSRFEVADIAAKLEVRGEDEVSWLMRIRYAKDVPIALQWVVVPRKVGEIFLSDLRPGGLTKAYKQRMGIHRATADALYRPAVSTATEARYLELVKGDPIIEERRVSSRLVEEDGGSKKLPYEYLLTLYTDRTAIEFVWKDEINIEA